MPASGLVLATQKLDSITGRGTSTVRARVRVSGRVQGVFFRAETQSRARSLSLTGWVRNAPDGTVEAVFEGPSERVCSMLEWCRRGPNYAEVDDVTVGWEEPQGEDEFRIR